MNIVLVISKIGIDVNLSSHKTIKKFIIDEILRG